MIRVAIVGAAGRMGKSLIQAVSEADDMQLAVATERPDSGLLGVDAGELAGVGRNSIELRPSIEPLLGQFDVLIDFTSPRPTLQHLGLCRRAGKRIVIGTTGMTEAQKAEVAVAAKAIGVVMAPNMSVGVNQHSSI